MKEDERKVLHRVNKMRIDWRWNLKAVAYLLKQQQQ